MSLKLVAPGKRKGNIFYLIRGTVSVWEDGRRITQRVERSTKTASRKEAQAILDQLEGKREALTKQNGAEKTFGEIAADYLKQGGSDRYLERPLDFFEHLPLSMVTDGLIMKCAAEAYPSAADTTRWRQFVTPSRAVVNFPKKKATAPKQNSRTIWVMPADVDRIINATRQSEKYHRWAPALTTFLFGQGSRMGETLAINAKRDLQLPYRRCVLRDTKNGHERVLHLQERTVRELAALPNINEDGPLFRKADGTAYADKGSSGHHALFFKNAVRAAGLNPNDVTPHVARHTFATWFYACTKDSQRLKDQGGWRSNQWERYAKLGGPELAEDVRRHGWDFAGENGGLFDVSQSNSL